MMNVCTTHHTHHPPGPGLCGCYRLAPCGPPLRILAARLEEYGAASGAPGRPKRRVPLAACCAPHPQGMGRMIGRGRHEGGFVYIVLGACVVTYLSGHARTHLHTPHTALGAASARGDGLDAARRPGTGPAAAPAQPAGMFHFVSGLIEGIGSDVVAYVVLIRLQLKKKKNRCSSCWGSICRPCWRRPTGPFSSRRSIQLWCC